MDTVSKVFGINAPKVAKSKLIGHRCSNPDLLMGLELEIERVPKPGNWLVEHIPAAIWTIDRDGSLRPPELSYEFISKPLQMEFMLGELQSFFDKLKLEPACYSDRTSVHVHTNVCDFTQKELATLALIYVTFEDVLFQFVNHYKSPSEQGYCRDTNIYCIPWNQCRLNHGLVNTIFSNPNLAFARWQKYTALNLLPVLNQGTVEWRHMHGTNDMEKLTIWLNLIGSIMKFSKNTDFDEVVKTIKVLNDTSAYQQFFGQVLEDRLPYDPMYQQALAEGIIHAKYTLINWDKLKGKKVAAPERAQEIERMLDDEDHDDDEIHDDPPAWDRPNLDVAPAPRAAPGRVRRPAPRPDRGLLQGRPVEQADVPGVGQGMAAANGWAGQRFAELRLQEAQQRMVQQQADVQAGIARAAAHRWDFLQADPFAVGNQNNNGGNE